ncbi:hypothetical protein FXW78_47355 [Rhodococcus opacus]|nr:hypothetical protein [Rhodococcus opacus]
MIEENPRLTRENAELRRINEVLRAASARLLPRVVAVKPRSAELGHAQTPVARRPPRHPQVGPDRAGSFPPPAPIRP